MQNMRRFMIRVRIALQFYARSALLAADFTKNERTLTNCQGGLPQVVHGIIQQTSQNTQKENNKKQSYCTKKNFVI